MPSARSQPKAEEQFKRFVETARKVDVDETGKEFERVFKKAVPPRHAPKPVARKR
jgi:hypothetical protein